MTYKKMTYSPPVKKTLDASTQKSVPSPQKLAVKADPRFASKKQSFTEKHDLQGCLKELTHIVEKDPKKAAEVFKTWLNKPSKVVKSKRAA